jgi:uncharacterized phage-associated protein
MAYNPRKAAQTIAYFAIKNGCAPLHVVKAVKLVYLADRESIQEFGFPIQDETRVSMKHGPVNSSTYRYVNGDQDAEASGWADFVSDRANHEIGLANSEICADDLDELSDADIQILDTVWEKFGGVDTWRLCDWTHESNNLPEWEDPGQSSIPIPLSRMMAAVGIEQPKEREQLVQDFQYINHLFARLS